MVEHGFTPEVAETVVATTEALAMMFYAMAFSAKQRLWIRERDNNTCQAEALQVDHDCNGGQELEEWRRKLQVHHIIPQRYARAVGIENADFPENAITLCEHFHQRDIHPDMQEALAEYRAGDKEAFKKVGEQRDRMIASKSVYWNETHDRRLAAMAIRNTQRMTTPFPEKGSRASATTDLSGLDIGSEDELETESS